MSWIRQTGLALKSFTDKTAHLWEHSQMKGKVQQMVSKQWQNKDQICGQMAKVWCYTAAPGAIAGSMAGAYDVHKEMRSPDLSDLFIYSAGYSVIGACWPICLGPFMIHRAMKKY